MTRRAWLGLGAATVLAGCGPAGGGTRGAGVGGGAAARAPGGRASTPAGGGSAGSSPGGGGSSSSDAKSVFGTIAVPTLGVPQEHAMQQAFGAKYPDVRLVPSGGQGGATAIAQGQADVVAYFNMPALIEQGGLLAALDPYIRASNLDLRPYGGLIDQMRYKGTLYDLPYAAQADVFVYNADLFRKAGVTPPQAGWTWNDLRTTARAVAQGSGTEKAWGLEVNAGEVDLVGSWLDALTGGQPQSATGGQLLTVLQQVQAMITDDHSMPAEVRVAGQPVVAGPADDFSAGRVGMTTANTGQLDYAAKSWHFQWDVVPYPVVPGQKASLPVSVLTMGVAATSKAADAAWAYVEFFTGPQGDAMLAGGTGMPPYRTAQTEAAWLAISGRPAGARALFALPWTVSGRFAPQPSGAAAAALSFQYDAAHKVLTGAASATTAVQGYVPA